VNAPAPVFALRQLDAVHALRDAGLPGQAWVLGQTRKPMVLLALALDAMGHDVAADAALDTLRRAVEGHLVAQRLAAEAAVARMRAARRAALWTRCPGCAGSGIGRGYHSCDTCRGACEVEA
jgi:hypothetical protein